MPPLVSHVPISHIPPADPGETLTKYLLALKDTLVELRHDSQDFERNPISIWEERKAAHVACFKARAAVYEEIVRVVAEGNVTPGVTHIVVDKGDEPKSNNTPVGYPSSDSIVERPSTAAETDSALHAFKVAAPARGADTEPEERTGGAHSGL